MNKNPAISVVMSVFNGEKYLRECIESILNQTFTDFEFLIFDDGSTDKSLEILQSYKDKRIILVHSNTNKGLVTHINVGIDSAKGKYIARMDADDVSLPLRFQKQYDFLEDDPEIGLCGAWVQGLGRYTNVAILPTTDKEIKLQMLLECPICQPVVMLRKDILKTNQLSYNQVLVPSEDYDLWQRMSAFTKFHNLPEVLLYYRHHTENISVKARNLAQENEVIISNINYLKWIFPTSILLNGDFEMIVLLLHRKLPQSPQNIDKIAKNIKKLLQKTPNKSSKNKENENLNENFDIKEITQLLKKSFFEYCTTSTHFGLIIWFKYIKSGLFSQSFRLNYRFLVKAIMKFKY